jgi:glycerate 2-kinase
MNGGAKKCTAIFVAGVRAALPGGAVRRFVRFVPPEGEGRGSCLWFGERGYDGSAFSKVCVLGAGKAVVPMASSFLESISEWAGADEDRSVYGQLITKYGHDDGALSRCSVLHEVSVSEAGHPVPDSSGEEASLRVLKMARDADSSTLVVVLLSGGGSSLMCLPVAGVTLSDLQVVSHALLESGATIHEVRGRQLG